MEKRMYWGMITGFILFGAWASCVKPFNPPALESAPGYLVVDGMAIPGGDTSVFTLTRSWNLSDSINPVPVTHAQVRVQSFSGANFNFTETSPGKYKALLSLNASEKYRLNIITPDGKQYFSNYEPVVITPAIDSLHWQQQGGVTILADTHDPAGNTRFYRWEYTETWEYHSYYESLLTPEYVFKCWDSLVSTRVIIATSKRLSEDLIRDQEIAEIPDTSQKMSVTYSILVRQYGLSENAFNFWEAMRKTGSEVGGLFDPQPSQVIGNIRNVGDTSEPVLGYFSIATVQKARLFVHYDQLENWQWKRINYADYCVASTDPGFPGEKLPAYQAGSPPVNYYAAPTCVDCRLQGGTIHKPGYWP